jgi:peptidoglycan hydrolase-like protein with peptidoglycan-binding domain
MITERIVTALVFSGLLVLGACGMHSDRNRGQTGQTPTGGELSSTQITQVQQALKAKGFDPGTTDGVMGAQTQQAIRNFQQANGLQATGRVDAQTAKALGVSTAAGQSRTGAGSASSMSRERGDSASDATGGSSGSSSGSSGSSGSGSGSSGSSSGSSGSGSSGDSSGGSSGGGSGGSGGGGGGGGGGGDR